MSYTYLLFHKHFFPSSLSFSFLRRFGGFFGSICLFFLGIIPTSYIKFLLCHCSLTLSSLEPFKGFFYWFLRFANTLWSFQWEIHRYNLGVLAVSRIVFCSQITECSQRCPDFIIKLLSISFWLMWVIPTCAALKRWLPTLSVVQFPGLLLQTAQKYNILLKRTIGRDVKNLLGYHDNDLVKKSHVSTRHCKLIIWAVFHLRLYLLHLLIINIGLNLISSRISLLLRTIADYKDHLSCK